MILTVLKNNSFQTESLNVHNEAKAVVTNVRDLVARTKEGQSYLLLLEKVLHKLKIMKWMKIQYLFIAFHL